MHPPRIGLALLACLALSACSPAATSTPSPLPSVPTCTPEFGGEPFPCTQQEFELQQQVDARYAEAERVLRRNAELEEEMYRSRTGSLPPGTADLYDPDGPYLEHQQGMAEVTPHLGFEGEFAIVGVERDPITSSDTHGSLALIACVDGSQAKFTYPDGRTDVGNSGPMRAVFTELDGTKIWSVTGAPEKECT